MNDIPTNLQHGEEYILRNKMQRRHDFQQFLESTRITQEVIYGMVLPFMKTRMASDPTHSWLYFMGGSTAWKSWADAVNAQFNSAMHKAAFVAGNTDVFVVANTEDTALTILEDMEGYIIPLLIRECNRRLERIGSPYVVHIERGGFSAVKGNRTEFTVDNPITYTLFPAWNIQVKLELPKRRVSTRGATAEPAYTEEQLQFDGKLVAYFDVGFVGTQVDLKTFAHNYVTVRDGVNYASELGLLTFGKLIPVARTMEKGLDVDTLRREVLLAKLQMTSGASLPAIYHGMVDVYWHVFNKSNVFVPDFVDREYMNIVKLLDPNVMTMCDYFESFIIEILRPSINAFIVETNNQLKTHWKDLDTAIMFVAGGDAMRRYKKDITTTKDIDTKVYCNPSSKTQAEKIISKNMSKLVCYLVRHRVSLFSHVPDDRLTVTSGKVDCFIRFKSKAKNNLQFRMRLIQKHPGFPLTLYSVDFRAYFVANYNGRKVTMQYDIPVLDVVIQDKPDGMTRQNAVETRHTNGIPVASKRFLVDDIVHTYQNDDLAVMRAWANKIGKDQQRLQHLRMLPKSSPEHTFSPAGEMVGRPVLLNAVDPQYTQYHSEDIQKYNRMFSSFRQKKKTVYKYKMPFDGEVIDIMSDEGFEIEQEVPYEAMEEDDPFRMSWSPA